VPLDVPRRLPILDEPRIYDYHYPWDARKARRNDAEGPGHGPTFRGWGLTVQRIVAGVGPDGRSAVVRDGGPPVVYRFRPPPGGVDSHSLKGAEPSDDLSGPGPGEVGIAELWATGPNLPPGTSDPTLAEQRWDVESAPGTSKWRLVMMGAGWQAPMHHTSTVDYDVILSGELELLLEDGTVTLRGGDTVVLPGVVHGWRAGPDGAAMAVTMLGVAEGHHQEPT
jgi:quercetin dioxygenase-like cupin family protein